jgi:hypothetical protein
MPCAFIGALTLVLINVLISLNLGMLANAATN